MRPPAVALAALALALVAGACSGPDEAAVRAELVDDVVAAVDGYVDALREGDLAALDELRCAAARLRPEELEAFLAPVVADLRRDLGELRVERAAVVNRVDGVTHARVDLAGAAGPVYPALVREDGRLRLCGASIDGAAERVASAKTRDGTEEPVLPALADLVATPPPAGFTATPDDGTAGSLLEGLDGFVAGDAVRWDDGAGRSVAVTAVDLETADQARAAQQELERELHDVVTELVVDGVPPGTRGFRYLAGYQLLLQPPGAGPVGDYVGLRAGNRIVAVFVVPLVPADGHELATAALAALLAGPTT